MNYKLYSSLIPVLKNTDVIVCLENLFTCNDGKCYMGHCCNPYDAAQEIDRLNEEAGKECFGLCLNTGHLNILSMDFRYYVSILRNRIKALHIHDNDGNSDLHKAPLTGNINWNHFCDSLKSAGYSGDLDFETFNQTNKVMDFDEEMLVPWLLLIEKTGEILRNKIIS